eukprot:Nitzschia sp. Nitz4//scaffold289_size23394//16458//17423//NITZ4_008480-RA/size23394-processed-gene-0.13-mRNA-1//-1//CDS//3329545831//2961//frame0
MMMRRVLQSQRVVNHRWFSTATSSDPSQWVSGLSSEQVESNPHIQEFIESNFLNTSDEDGVTATTEQLEKFGIVQSDFVTKGVQRPYGTPRVDLGLGSEAQQALNIRQLSAYRRTVEGTRACDDLRADNIIPGMLYGSDPTKGVLSMDKSTRVMIQTPWSELQRELDRFHRRFESRVYDLTIYEDESDQEGTVHRVIPRDVQRHPVQGKVYCVNYLRYHPGRPIKIPIVYINQEESPALKRDGYIIPVNKYIECLVEDGAPIPEALELECTGLVLKDVIRMDRLIFPDGVRPSKRVHPVKFVIGPVAGGRGGAKATEEEES